MRILTVLTYYRPHTSGLTIYVERLAKALVKRGHQVTILTSQYDKALKRNEILDGVRIVRVPVLFRVSKGVIMPLFGFYAWWLVFQHDVIHLHLPQFDAAGVALRGRLLRKPTIISYHSDLMLPKGVFNRIVNRVVFLMNDLAALFAHRIAAYTQDFADHSPYLLRFAKKVRIILPPVELPEVSDHEVKSFGEKHNPEKRRPVIGMATRFAAEKGVEVLLDALPTVLKRYPNAMVLFAGQYQDVMGEEQYYARLLPRIEEYRAQGQWKFLGVLSPQQMSAFYSNIDVLIVPSLNSTETFGLVQIEAMMHSVPTVASDLPGVRQPVRMTGMGEIIPVGDAVALAESLTKIFSNPEDYKGNPLKIREMFDPQTNAKNYEALYSELIGLLEKQDIS